MRKYLFNGAIIGAIVGAASLAQSTRTGPRDWKLVVMWIGWALSLAVAVGTVREQSHERKDPQN